MQKIKKCELFFQINKKMLSLQIGFKGIKIVSFLFTQIAIKI